MKFKKIYFSLFLFAFLTQLSLAASKSRAETKTELNIPASYGKWHLDTKPDFIYQGRQILNLKPGTHTLTGKLGWSLCLVVSKKNMYPQKIIPGKYGRDLSGLLFSGKKLTLPLPPGKRIIIAIPASAGKYEIDELLAPGTGHRAVFLTTGNTKISAENWEITLTLKKNILTAKWLNQPAKTIKLTVKDNIVTWQQTNASQERGRQKEEFLLTLPDKRFIFSRDENLNLNIFFKDPKSHHNICTITVVQNKQETLLFQQVWKTLPGNNSLSFEIAASILKAGKYKLRVDFANKQAFVDIQIAASSLKWLIPDFSLNISHPYDPEAAFKSGASTWLMQTQTDSNNKKIPIDIAKMISQATANTLNVWNLIKTDFSKITLSDTIRANLLLGQRLRKFSCYQGALLAKVTDFKESRQQIHVLRQGLSQLRAGKFAVFTDLASLNDTDFYKSTFKSYVFDCRKSKTKLCSLCKKLLQTDNFYFCPANKNQAYLALALGAEKLLLNSSFESKVIQSLNRLVPAVRAINSDKLKQNKLQLFGICGDKKTKLEKSAESCQTLILPVSSGQANYRWVFSCAKKMLVKLPEPEKTRAIYDLGEEKSLLLPQPSDQPAQYELSMPSHTAKLIAFLPEKPAAIRVTARIRRGNNYKQLLYFKGIITNERRLPVKAVLPAQVIIKNPQNKELIKLQQCFKNGILQGVYPLALNHQDGFYQVEIYFKPDNLRGSAKVIYRPYLKMFASDLRLHASLEIEYKKEVISMFKAMRQPLITINKTEQLGAAQQIQTHLLSLGIKAEVKFVNEVLALQSSKSCKLPYAPEKLIARDLILLGTATDNLLISELTEKYKLTLLSCDDKFPGKGKGLIQGVRQAFSRKHNVIILAGSDVVGIRRTVKFMTSIF